MLRSLIHVGLAALLVIAPALCCCSVRHLAGLAMASTSGNPAGTDSIALEGSACCHAAKPVKPVKKASCCHVSEPVKSDAQGKSQPVAPKPDRCSVCDERPEATPPEAAPLVAGPAPTGEILPVASATLASLPETHLGLISGLDPPERAGVDSRYDSLFVRHVLRC